MVTGVGPSGFGIPGVNPICPILRKSLRAHHGQKALSQKTRLVDTKSWSWKREPSAGSHSKKGAGFKGEQLRLRGGEYNELVPLGCFSPHCYLSGGVVGLKKQFEVIIGHIIFLSPSPHSFSGYC